MIIDKHNRTNNNPEDTTKEDGIGSPRVTGKFLIDNYEVIEEYKSLFLMTLCEVDREYPVDRFELSIVSVWMSFYNEHGDEGIIFRAPEYEHYNNLYLLDKNVFEYTQKEFLEVLEDAKVSAEQDSDDSSLAAYVPEKLEEVMPSVVKGTFLDGGDGLYKASSTIKVGDTILMKDAGALRLFRVDKTKVKVDSRSSLDTLTGTLFKMGKEV